MSKQAAVSSSDAAAPIFAERRTYPGIDGVMEVATRMVTDYTGREQMRDLGLSITRAIPSNPDSRLPDLRNIDEIAKAVYRWITRNINYVRDPWNVERIQSPDVTLRQKAGDCDDHAILSAALLQSLGIPTGFRIVSRTGRSYDHIYCVYKSPGGWKSFDTTVARHPGYEFDERLIKKSKHLPNAMPEGLGIDPLTATAAATTALQTGVTMKSLFSSWFGAKDKAARTERGQWREYLMERGVRSEVISFSHEDNQVLKRYAQIIEEYGQPAVYHLNRYGDLTPAFLADQQQKKRNNNLALYGSLSVGALALAGAGIWAINHL